MKKFIITANWKLNGNNVLIYSFIKKLKYYFDTNQILSNIIFTPPVIYINNIKNTIQNDNFFIGAQNVDIHYSGAFTGEISIDMLQDIGVNYVIIGHSERRIFHREDNAYIAKKFQIIKSKNIIPILCLGENLQEKNLKQSELICRKQIDAILNLKEKDVFKNSIIAYEPIWAIGTGQTADIKYVNKMHKFIKYYISDNSDVDIKNIIVQYGGSVNLCNIKDFMNTDFVNGVLLGTASLQFSTFIQIIQYINQAYYA
ncbi:Triosephosphate isomerase [Buchnera aphidicola (Takecallis arundicolens)]|uniref:triose-phosphate isomerase n=1 Tax=Buchnera aphidicola TaxID=9 RepID=UPI0034643DF4